MPRSTNHGIPGPRRSLRALEIFDLLLRRDHITLVDCEAELDMDDAAARRVLRALSRRYPIIRKSDPAPTGRNGNRRMTYSLSPEFKLELIGVESISQKLDLRMGVKNLS